MILDAENLFTTPDGQDVAATAASTDVIDLGPRGPSKGDIDTPVIVRVLEDVTAAGSATVSVSLRTSATLTGSALASAITLYTSAAIPKATLVAGYEFTLCHVPIGALRYLDVYFTVASGPLTNTNENFMAALALDRQTND
jgi:hypothetical protein